MQLSAERKFGSTLERYARTTHNARLAALITYHFAVRQIIALRRYMRPGMLAPPNLPIFSL